MKELDYTYLIAGAAILVTLLSLWAQSWVRLGSNVNRGELRQRKQASATIGLLWVYMATVIAILAIGLFLIGRYWEGSEGSLDWVFEWGIGFLIVAFLMGLANMAESTLLLFLRICKGKTAFDASFGVDSSKLGKKLSIKLAVIVLSLLVVSISGVVYAHWIWWFWLPIFAFALYEYYELIQD